MKDLLTEEKALLMMKGEALRMKLAAQTERTQQNISCPFNQWKSLAGSLSLPLARSILLALIDRKILTKRNLAYSALSLAGLYLLNRKDR